MQNTCTPRAFEKSELLYGEWLYKPGCFPVIVEGMTDAMNLYQKGMKPPFAVPLGVMGGSAAESQIQRILDVFPKGPIVIMRDHDDPEKYPELPPGVAQGDIMASSLESGIKMLDDSRRVIQVYPPIGSDPGDLSTSQVAEVCEFLSAWIKSDGESQDFLRISC